MFYVKTMSPKDFKFAVNLTDEQDWGFVEEDFKFMMTLEPEGCFVLFDDSERIGIVTSISFDRIGWFGNLIVKEEYRKKGAGTLLVRKVIDYLSNKNIKNVGLFSYLATIPFYEKNGFKCDSEFIVLNGKAFSSPIGKDVRKAKKTEFQDIVNYDMKCFGASRKKLLEPIFNNNSNLCFLSKENNLIIGYAMAKVYEKVSEIGPLVCQQGRDDVAVALLKSIFNNLSGFTVSLCVAKRETSIIDFLKSFGFSELFHVMRMFLRASNVKECIYFAESLERG